MSNILAPSYGKVIEVKTESGTNGVYYWHISTFLSPLDNHTQFIPVKCECTGMLYKQGEFHIAHMLGKSDKNERWETTFKADKLGHFVVTQIAGLIAKRIINKCKVGKQYYQADPYGEILLGSRVDITFTAKGVTVNVKKGDKLVGAQTVIATY